MKDEQNVRSRPSGRNSERVYTRGHDRDGDRFEAGDLARGAVPHSQWKIGDIGGNGDPDRSFDRNNARIMARQSAEVGSLARRTTTFSAGVGFLVMRHVAGRFEPYQLLAFRGIKAIKVSPGQKTRGDLVVSTLNEEYGDIQSRNLMKEIQILHLGKKGVRNRQKEPFQRSAWTSVFRLLPRLRTVSVSTRLRRFFRP